MKDINAQPTNYLLLLLLIIGISANTVNAQSADDAAARKGKIAVLPFDYISNDPAIAPEQMGAQVQNACANSLRDNAPALNVQDPMTTNAILGKNNIDASNLKTILPDEIAKMLGVQYVTYGSFNLIDKGTTTTGSAVTSYKDKDNKNYSESGSKKESKGSAVTTTSSSSRESYDATVEIKIFDDQGAVVFTESKKPFSAGLDSYTGSLDYIVKRSPWGKKGKK